MGKVLVLCILALIGIVLLAQDNTPQKELGEQQKKLSAEKLEDGDLVIVSGEKKQTVFCFKRGHKENTWFAKCPAGPFGGGSSVDWAYAQRIVRPNEADYCKFTAQFMKQ